MISCSNNHQKCHEKWWNLSFFWTFLWFFVGNIWLIFHEKSWNIAKYRPKITQKRVKRAQNSPKSMILALKSMKFHKIIWNLNLKKPRFLAKKWCFLIFIFIYFHELFHEIHHFMKNNMKFNHQKKTFFIQKMMFFDNIFRFIFIKIWCFL